MSFDEFWNECKAIGYERGYSENELDNLISNFYDHYDNGLLPHEACRFEL